MEVTKEKLIKQYTQSIREGNAAIFAGAGLSRGSGCADWKTFLRPLAMDLGLDIEKETDFLSIAQYYRNEFGNRAGINREILNVFNSESGENENVRIITQLPISTYWTTNYDKLIENGLEKANRKADVKINSDQLSYAAFDRDAIVYKMHGDADHPANAVLTKDDYVLYSKKRPFFKEILKGDLISKKFLFIGFSFQDPNLDYILSQVHALLDENVAEHYCFFRRVQRSDFIRSEDYCYEMAKQELRIRDIARYGIQTVFVDDYSEITAVLHSISFSVKRNNVFISGSADDYGVWGKGRAEELESNLSACLIKEGFKITSGFGIGLGSSVINGALSEIYRNKYRHIEQYLCLWPFPQGIKNVMEQNIIYTKYRKDMISETGIAIFLFGNKKIREDSLELMDASGCWEEFEIARENQNIIIPIGSTGFMAKRIFNEVRENIDSFKYLKNHLNVLEEEMNPDRLIKTIIDIANGQRII